MARPVRFNIHPKEADIHDNIAISDMPDGSQGEGYFATSFEQVVGLARKNSIWPLPFATSCCGIEFMATMAPHYDLARFGAERLGFSGAAAHATGSSGDCHRRRENICNRRATEWQLSAECCHHGNV